MRLFIMPGKSCRGKQIIFLSCLKNSLKILIFLDFTPLSTICCDRLFFFVFVAYRGINSYILSSKFSKNLSKTVRFSHFTKDFFHLGYLLVVSIFLNFNPFFHICQVLSWHPLLPDAYMYSM